MMTAAGTLKPATVYWVGVAGLQAIAIAKRLKKLKYLIPGRLLKNGKIIGAVRKKI